MNPPRQNPWRVSKETPRDMSPALAPKSSRYASEDAGEYLLPNIRTVGTIQKRFIARTIIARTAVLLIVAADLDFTVWITKRTRYTIMSIAAPWLLTDAMKVTIAALAKEFFLFSRNSWKNFIARGHSA